MVADPDKKSTITEAFSSQSTLKFYQLAEQGNCVKQVANVDRSFQAR